MKARDIEKRLEERVPILTDRFTREDSIVSITPAGLVATATTSVDHGLSIGKTVFIAGAFAPVAITSIDRVDEIATAVTTTDHDLTEGHFTEVELSGATESEFNGTFPLLTVPNRRTFTFTVADAGPTSGTGAMMLDGPGTAVGYNGKVTVATVPTTTTFTYALPSALTEAATGPNMRVIKGIRIHSAISLQRATHVFEKSDISGDDLSAFVVLGATTASRDRRTLNDGVSSAQVGGDNKQQLLQALNVLVFQKVVDKTSGATPRDEMEDIARILIAVLVGFVPPSDFSTQTQEALRFVNHDIFEYTTATYSHLFEFQLREAIENEDLEITPENVAFRDILLTFTTDQGDQELIATIDLDAEPFDSLIMNMPLASDLSFIKGVAPASYTRGSESFYRDLAGLLTLSPSTGGNNQAPFEQNGVLIEDASTNLEPNAEIGNASFPWGIAGSGTNSHPDPLGGSNAFLSTGDLAGFTTRANLVPLVMSTNYDISVFVSESTIGNHFDFGVSTSLTIDNGVRCQWIAGVPTLTSFYGNGSNLRIEEYSLGYWRLTVNVTNGVAGPFFAVVAGKDTAESGGTFFYGYDSESTLTSFIRSQGATKTRTAATLNIPVANIPSNANFTVAVNADTSAATGGDRHVIGISHIGSTGVKFNSAGQVVFTYNGTSSTPVNLGLGVSARLGMVYDKATATINGYIDGVRVVTDLAVTPQPAAITAIYLGADSSGNNHLKGHNKNLRSYIDPLTPEEMANEGA